MVEHTQQESRLTTLIKIQMDGTSIGALDQGYWKVNIFFWKGWLIEIQCQAIDDHWTPFLVEYHTLTSEYTKTLVQQLTSNQRSRLTTIMKTYGLN